MDLKKMKLAIYSNLLLDMIIKSDFIFYLNHWNLKIFTQYCLIFVHGLIQGSLCVREHMAELSHAFLNISNCNFRWEH